MASKKKSKTEDQDLEDTKNKKLKPEDWEDAEEDPEEVIPEGEESGDPAKEGAKTDSDDGLGDDVVVIPEPPRDNKPRGPRDAIWSCGDHETRGFENRRPNCRVSSCDKPTTLKIVYEEKQRRAKDPTKAG